jgi:glutathione S-transferase
MSDQQPITVHGFETSNNMKVRIALGYKGIPYTFHTIDPADRAEIVRISGQYLTPVLVHGDRVVFDSAAILRYLDANYPDTPKLYGADRTEQWEIEEWERFGRGPLADPMMSLVHARVGGQEVGEARRSAAADRFAQTVRRVEERLAGREWLVGGGISAADITCAAVLHRVRSTAVLPWPAGCPRSERLSERIIALLQ